MKARRIFMAAMLGGVATFTAYVLNLDHSVRHQLIYLYLMVWVFSGLYTWERMR